MSATMGVSKVDVLFAEAKESVVSFQSYYEMPTTVRNAYNRRRIEMDALKSSTWEVQRLICFMSGKSSILEKVDDSQLMHLNTLFIVIPFNIIQ